MRHINHLLLVALLACCPVDAYGALLIQPAAASTDMGSTLNMTPDKVIDQSGLSSGYTSLVDDFDIYIASNPTHDGSGEQNLYSSASGTTTGNFDFDLGGNFTIESFALWNLGGDLSPNIIGFTLLADDNAAFSSPVVLGSYSANPNTGAVSAVLPEVFPFTSTEASHVRMQITSNNGHSNLTVFGEAVFEGQAAAAVPEPASLALLGLSSLFGVGIAAQRRRAMRRDAEIAEC